jgi:archaellin
MNLYKLHNNPDELYGFNKIIFQKDAVKRLLRGDSLNGKVVIGKTGDLSLDLSKTNISRIDSPNLTVLELNLSGTPIIELPYNLTVKKTLNISNTMIETLPDNLTVKNLIINNTPLSDNILNILKNNESAEDKRSELTNIFDNTSIDMDGLFGNASSNNLFKYDYHVIFTYEMNDFDADSRISVDTFYEFGAEEIVDSLTSTTGELHHNIGGMRMRARIQTSSGLYAIHSDSELEREDVEYYLNSLSTDKFKDFIENSKF